MKRMASFLIALVSFAASSAVPASEAWTNAVTPPGDGGSIELDQQAGDCANPTILQNHDGTVENAYAWLLSGVRAPDYGAFAECFEGSASICELQFFFSQIGNDSGQTMDVYVWDDTGVQSPGNVLAMMPGVDPGPIQEWPSISQHNVSLPLVVSGRWWIGYWGDWPGAEAGWFIAADENGPGGCPRTKIAPGIGYPTGWEHPSTIFSWQNCKSLAMQVVVDAASSVGERAGVVTPRRMIRRVAPNPFAHRTEIEYRLPRAGHVDLSVFDVAGRRVARLADGFVAAGSHRLTWDGTEAGGGYAAAGIYYATLRTGEVEETRRLVLLR